MVKSFTHSIGSGRGPRNAGRPQLGLAEDAVDGLFQFTDLRVAALLLLRKDEFAVHADFELAAGARDECEAFGEVSEGGQEFLRRPRGACGVVSDDAVGDGDIEPRFSGHWRFTPQVSQ